MSDSDEPRHPIRVVARRTGLSAPVLRAWERRYGAVKPSRSEGGQRLYSDADVHRLQLLATAVDGGRTIGLIADLGATELQALIDEDRETPLRTSPDAVPPDRDRIAAAMKLIDELRSDDLERYLMRMAVELRPRELVEGVVVPLLQEVGRAWQAGRIPPATEHIASVAFRRFLDWLSTTDQPGGDARLVVTGTPSGQRHEFGALLAGVVASHEGWRVRFVGPDLPSDDIARAAHKLGASMVALSAVHPRLDRRGVEEVVRLRKLLPASVELVIGGAGAEAYGSEWEEAGIVNPPSLSDFREMLAERSG